MRWYQLFCIIYSLIIAKNSYGQLFPVSQVQRCEQSYSAFKTATTISQKQIDDCLVSCDYSKYKPGVHIDYNRLKAGYDYCISLSPGSVSSGATGAGAKCDAAAAKLSTTQDQAFWETCIADCEAAAGETTDATKKQKYTSTSSACGEKMPLEQQNPLETIEDGDTVADDDATDGDPPADTGSPNNTALNSMLEGLGTASSSRTPIDGGRGLNFGGGGSRAGYSDVTGAGGGAGGFQGSGNNYIPPIDDRYMGTAPPANANNNGSPAGGGGGSGGGGGGAGGAPGGAAPGRPGAGGPRTSIAGSALGKFGTNQFWSGGSEGGGSGGAAAPARKTATAVKDKKTPGPEYLNKGLGNDGLLRLWGAGLQKPTSGYQTQSCKDHTIFCSMENFEFTELMDRSPDSSGK